MAGNCVNICYEEPSPEELVKEECEFTEGLEYEYELHQLENKQETDVKPFYEVILPEEHDVPSLQSCPSDPLAVKLEDPENTSVIKVKEENEFTEVLENEQYQLEYEHEPDFKPFYQVMLPEEHAVSSVQDNLDQESKLGENQNVSEGSDKTRQCASFEYGSDRESSAASHNVIHSKCSVYEGGSKKEKDLKLCMVVCSEEKQFTCSVCTFSCNKRYLLNDHILEHIRSNERPFKCVVCGMLFLSKGVLRVHMTTHSNVKPFECSVCEARFKRKDILKRHITTHSDEKLFKCSVCESSFKNKKVLQVHMLIHSKEKPYKCSVCKSRFKRSDVLRDHIRSHSNEQPFKCPECEVRCKTDASLKRHMRTHSSERPYKCSQCECRFKRKDHLMCHVKTHFN